MYTISCSVYTINHPISLHDALPIFPGHPQNAMVTGGKALRSRGTDGAAPAAWGGSALGWCVEARHAQESAVSTESPDRKSTRLNSSHVSISYAVFCLKKKNT